MNSSLKYLEEFKALPPQLLPRFANGPLPLVVAAADPELRNDVEIRLRDGGRWQVKCAETGAAALEIISDFQPCVVLLGDQLGDLLPTEFREILRAQHPDVEVIDVRVEAGQPFVDSQRAAVAPLVACLGSKKPVSMDGRVPRPSSGVSGLPGMIGSSPSMLRVHELARLVAPRDTSVLITGESGTGKDLLARAIHLLSSRRSHKFIVINCAAIPEPLLEAELFGYTKGAFTGAVASRIGRLQAAHGGTLFLDEIGEMPLNLQAKLLRFLEQGDIQRLGSSETFKVDVRVVAATNASLKQMIAEKTFREDLYYRLNVFPLHLPPLRERLEDLPAIAYFLLSQYRSDAVNISQEAMETLAQYHWPGNVRELKNVIERASILMRTGDEVTPEHVVI